MSAHAERVYPEECCGLLLGKLDRTSRDEAPLYQVVELILLENRWNADSSGSTASGFTPSGFTKKRRYTIDPKDMLRSQKQARERGLSIIGIYHSHPDHVAEPSECDRIQAWPDYIYSIVSVMKGRAVDTLHWTLDSDHQFQPVQVQSASIQPAPIQPV